MSQRRPLTITQALSKAKKAAKRGNLESALELYNAVLRHEPGNPVAARAARRLHKKLTGAQAERIYAPGPPQDQIDALIDLYHSGEMTETEEACRDLLNAHPKSMILINVLGAALKGQGKLHEAVQSFDTAIQFNPEYAEAYSNRGVVLQELGKLEDAISDFDKATQLKPDYAEAYSNRGLALQELRRFDDAIANYRKALSIKPDYAAAHSNLGNVFLLKGQAGEAFECHRKAVALAPQDESFWAGLARSLPGLSFTSADEDFVRELSFLVTRPTVQPSSIARPILSVLWQLPGFAAAVDAIVSGEPAPDTSLSTYVEQLSAIDLFLQVLRLSPIFDLKVERALTVLRRAMLQKAITETPDEKVSPFAIALALQCFTNEYVYSETNDERIAVDSLERQVSDLTKNDQLVPASSIAVLGSYRPLHQFPWAEGISAQEWTGDIEELIRRQITEPLSERALRSQIPCLTTVENAVSQSVREQYEENPYPRWINAGLSGTAKSIDKVLSATLPHLDGEEYSSPEAPEILIAGCGTGQHALTTASRYAKSAVLAVDLSLSSISYAIRKSSELGVSNIEYAQADIMALGALGRQFDLIESVGVLHHLGDPVAGWRILVDLLRPGGLMKIGLYSELARRDVVACRDLISEKRYTTSAEDIRRCRQDIISLSAAGDKSMDQVFSKNDFFSTSECRDLLFHVQEHRFTVPQLEEALTELELTFLGFEMREQTAQIMFRNLNPRNADLTSLRLWHQFEFENPDTFSNMYQFWCRKKPAS